MGATPSPQSGSRGSARSRFKTCYVIRHMVSTDSRIESTEKDAFRKMEETGGKHDFCHGYRDHRICRSNADRTVCSYRNYFFFQQEKNEWGNGQKAHMVSQAARSDPAS